MQRMGMIAPGADLAVRSAVTRMFERVGASGALQVAGSQVLGLKDEAKRLKIIRDNVAQLYGFGNGG